MQYITDEHAITTTLSLKICGGTPVEENLYILSGYGEITSVMASNLFLKSTKLPKLRLETLEQGVAHSNTVIVAIKATCAIMALYLVAASRKFRFAAANALD